MTHSPHHIRQWTAQEVTDATGGKWISSLPEEWRSSGFCHHAPFFRPEDILVVRQHEGEKGVSLEAARHLKPAAYMASGPLPDRMSPVLVVDDNVRAMLDMGRYARSHMNGKVVGITGSAGKTTLTAMLTHVLSEARHTVKGSVHSANLPVGIAWNIASVHPDTEFVITEMAIGRMGVSSDLVRPQIAVFTNIYPAHQGQGTLMDIVRTKSAIFKGMSPGDTVVLNHDMLERKTVVKAAEKKQLNILFYGSGDACNGQLLHYAPQTGVVSAQIDGQNVSFTMEARGYHMALNAVATLTVCYALQISALDVIPGLERFRPLSGRGELIETSLSGKHVTVIDDSYNANPGSMKASLNRLNEYTGRHCIAILGQMEELGADAERYHAELAEIINKSGISMVICMGELWHSFWNELLPGKRGFYGKTTDEVWYYLLTVLSDNDVLLFKGSHSTRIHTLVGRIKTQE